MLWKIPIGCTILIKNQTNAKSMLLSSQIISNHAMKLQREEHMLQCCDKESENKLNSI